MTRQQLKALVKECLVELLQEGLGTTVLPESKSNAPKPSAQVRTKPKQYAPGNRTPTSALTEAIRIESGGNKVIADILADTAMTTLPKMLSNGDSAARPAEGIQASRSQNEQFNGSPEEVFGEEISSKWANLAFMEPPAKKSA